MIIKGIYLLNVGYFYGPVTNYKITAYFMKSSMVPSWKSGCSAVILKLKNKNYHIPVVKCKNIQHDVS